ncbi:FimV family protein [Psychrobacter urativorans]|uniref:type IV pilus assembly protein FimV n=1 Tax=Psychrobacter urativorans TaxID=45610 RepID=UPI00191AC94A|nr:hypothetical protein [Psychrobacter urativorans]
MSWHLPQRLTNIHLTAVHKTLATGLLYSISATLSLATAQAATIGKIVVTSEQHQPLVAIISVTDIHTEDFSASLANPVVYQQLGLIPTDSMSVHFVTTSADAGTMVISTTQPVSKPFADVVLSINEKGQRNIIPKTLLMPLHKSVAIRQPNQATATAQKTNLSVVSDHTAQTLAVKRGAPPPLFASSSPSVASSAMANAQILAIAMPSTKIPSASTANVSNGSATAVPKDIAPDNQTITISYDVQRNDSLWSIAKKIAVQNNIDVQAVMKKIQHQNPDAFIAQDANRLRADAQLQLPNYQTRPSQKSLPVAIAAHRAHYRVKPLADDPINKAEQAVATEKAIAIPTKLTVTKSTAGNDTESDSTESKAQSAAVSTVSIDILATLKQSKQSKVAQDQEVQAANHTLIGYRQKL